jgi:hypothetical protein
MVMPSWASNPVNTGKSMGDPPPPGNLVVNTVTVSSIQFLTGNSLWNGSGVPAAGLGINGDYYFRIDTPGTANQRIYVKSAGAWAGIV